MNTDIGGIGVRISFYLQTIFLGGRLYLPLMPDPELSIHTSRVQLHSLPGQRHSMRLQVLYLL